MSKVHHHDLTVSDLVAGYRDEGDGGVVGYGGALDIRPPSLTMRSELIHCVR
ncbi:MAG: hypothetical protein OXI77_08550 [Chloroflexota bacterium]|nr:hypothetical protein [Chloroflexota bacterium]MDE2910728.1 hypothetical protein [Chloroflexota bacterium]